MRWLGRQELESGGRKYPYRTEYRCKTCTHPLRAEIERAVVMGTPYRLVAAQLPQGDDLTTRNIRNHFQRGHHPFLLMARHAIWELKVKQGTATLGQCLGLVNYAVIQRSRSKDTCEQRRQSYRRWSF